MFNFTEEQRFAALTLGKPMVITAAAGSGKTTVLVARYLELLKSGLLPTEILTMTFTTEAAEQLRKRISIALAKDLSLSHLAKEVERTRFIGTIHSFCYYLLQEFGSLLGYPPIEEIISDYQFQVKIETAYRKWIHSLSSSQLASVLSKVSRSELRDLFLSFYEARNTAKFANKMDEEDPTFSFFETINPFLVELEMDLHSNGLFRFDDLEQLSLRILENHSNVRTKLQTQFKAFLIDEFQDTSQNQWSIFQKLLGNEYNKLFVVGDPKQSIYSFRHADVSLFYKVSRLTEDWGGVIAELNTNFRTQSTLILDINRFSRNFFNTNPVSFQPMTSGKRVEGEPIKINYYDCESNTDRKTDKKKAELNAVLEAIDEYQQKGNRLGDLALLFRMGDRIDSYRSALIAKGILVNCTQTLSLFSHHDILDLNHYLKALNRPSDSFSLAAFLYSPWIGLPLSELAALRDDESALPFEEKVKNHLSPRLNWFFTLSNHFRVSVREALFALFENSSYFPIQYEAFFEWLKPLTEKHYSIVEALNDLDLWKKEKILFKSKSGETSPHAIKLMTVHAAKGLEFEDVFLVDNLRKAPTQLPILLTAPNEPPAMKYREKTEVIMSPQYLRLKEIKEQLDTEESKRILYVAITRAKNTLTLFLPSEMKGVAQGSWASLLSQASKSS